MSQADVSYNKYRTCKVSFSCAVKNPFSCAVRNPFLTVYRNNNTLKIAQECFTSADLFADTGKNLTCGNYPDLTLNASMTLRTNSSELIFNEKR